MQFKKTVYKKNMSYPNFRNDVIYVGFNLTKQINWLKDASVFAGFAGATLIPTVSEAKSFLEESNNLDNSICIVNAKYNYSNTKSDSIPISEVPFYTLDDLSYYESLNGLFVGFFQGFQFIRKVAKDYPNIDFAVYGAYHEGVFSQAREMKVDYIPKLSDSVYVPFTILEYLRNKNSYLFEVEK